MLQMRLEKLLEAVGHTTRNNYCMENYCRNPLIELNMLQGVALQSGH